MISIILTFIYYRFLGPFMLNFQVTLSKTPSAPTPSPSHCVNSLVILGFGVEHLLETARAKLSSGDDPYGAPIRSNVSRIFLDEEVTESGNELSAVIDH